MIPTGKIQELQQLNNPSIIQPLNILLHPVKKTVPIGFTMVPVPEKVFLCQFFVTDFWDDNKISPDTIVSLSEGIIETISFIHGKKTLIVDLNEFNILSTESDLTKSFFIDTNSYQTPSYPATAINLAIKDWHSKGYSTETDWFSAAILICQLFLGIHPFLGGSNQQFPKQMKKNSQEYIKARVLGNTSIFHSDIKLPPSVREFDIVPNGYMDWFINMFEKGQRVPPPSIAGAFVAVVKIDVVKSTNTFTITMMKEFNEKIRRVKYLEQNEIVTTSNHIYLNGKKVEVKSSKSDVIFLPSLTPILIQIIRDTLHLTNLRTGEEITTLNNFGATDLLVFENYIYTKNGKKVTEINITEFTSSQRIVASCGSSWSIMSKSSQVLNGMIYQDMIGKAYLLIPAINSRGDTYLNLVQVPELDGSKILNGKYDNRVAVIVGRKDQMYIKFILRFDENNISYHIRSEESAEFPIINFVGLDNGACVMINNDGSMELFFNDPMKTTVNKIEDSQIDVGMTLAKNGSNVLFFKDKRLFGIKSKKGN